MDNLFKIAGTLLFFSMVYVSGFAADCTTTADDVWDCGTPTGSDNLIVNHTVTIAGDFNTTGSITVNDGGQLTVSGSLNGAGCDILVNPGGTLVVGDDVTLSANSSINNQGTIVINDNLTLDNSAGGSTSGSILVKGDAFITQGSTLVIESGATFSTQDKLDIDSNGVTIDGTVNVAGEFINDKSISGTGEIVTLSGCSGTGSINGVDASTYCGAGTINMGGLLCGPDDVDPIISAMPADMTLYTPANNCSVAASWVEPTANDDCHLESFTSSHQPGYVFSVGSTTITYTATDAVGNTAEASFVVTLLDTISPTVDNLPLNITQPTDGISCGAIVSWTTPSATDNCTLQSFTPSHNPGDFFDIGTTTVTYTAIDDASNTVVASFEVTIEDNITPSITQMPGTIIAYADASNCGTNVDWPQPVASDNCSIDSLNASIDPGEFFDIGTTQVTYSAVDKSQNRILASFNVIVEDTISPTIINLPESITVFADAGSCGANVDWDIPSASDNCTVQSLTSTNTPGELFDIGITKVTYTAIDQSNNSFSASFEIVVKDTLAPIISNVPESMTRYADAASCGAVVNWVTPGITDNCTMVNITSSNNSGEVFQPGTTTVTYTATDASDNSAIASFDITVIDTLSPSITNLPEDIIHYTAAGECNSIIDWIPPDATDNCTLQSFTSTNNPGDVFDLGTTTITYTATDADQNVVNASFEIIVMDTISPRMTNMPDSIIQYADANSRGTAVNWTVPSVGSDCSVSVEASHEPGEFFDVGTTTVTYTLVDAADNMSVDSFYITVLDTIAPTLAMPEDITQYVSSASCGEIVDFELPIATDNDAIHSLISTQQPGDFFEVGTTTVTYTAIDESQNEASMSFNITLIDTIAPVINDLPEEIKRMADAGACGKRINWPEPTVTDNCSASISSSHSPDDFFKVGITTVTYTAIDIHGNESTSSFDIMVGKNPEDEIQLAFSDTTVAKGESIQLFAGGNGVEYRWEPETYLDHPGIQNPTATPTESIVYNVFMRTETGCHDKKQVTLHVRARDSYFIPEMFTPDGDGVNDMLYVNTIGYGAIEFKLFNRFGQLVFSTDDSDIGWDGRINGQLQKPDTYVYTLVLEVSDDETISEKGTIQLVR